MPAQVPLTAPFDGQAAAQVLRSADGGIMEEVRPPRQSTFARPLPAGTTTRGFSHGPRLRLCMRTAVPGADVRRWSRPLPALPARLADRRRTTPSRTGAGSATSFVAHLDR